MTDRLLNLFADWFASRGGVIQTAVVVLAWTLAACAWSGLDPNLFRTMAVLTVYSAVTQPVLGYCNKRVAEKADRDVTHLQAGEDAILANIAVLAKDTHEMVSELHAERA